MKWEYKRVQTYHIQESEKLDDLLKELGEQEWELVMPFGQLLIFKRAKAIKPVKNPATRKPK